MELARPVCLIGASPSSLYNSYKNTQIRAVGHDKQSTKPYYQLPNIGWDY